MVSIPDNTQPMRVSRVTLYEYTDNDVSSIVGLPRGLVGDSRMSRARVRLCDISRIPLCRPPLQPPCVAVTD